MKYIRPVVYFSFIMLSTFNVWGQEVPVNRYPANNCEFYVNGFVNSHGQYLFDWQYITSYISVDAISLVHRQKGQVLQVGMIANGKDVFLGKEIEPAYYAIRIDLKPLKSTGQGGYVPGPEYILKNFYYFMDIKRENGDTERLILKNGEKDFLWPDDYEKYPQIRIGYLGRGDIYALRNDAENASPLFNQKKACEPKK
jgi:hypothetical protein